MATIISCSVSNATTSEVMHASEEHKEDANFEYRTGNPSKNSFFKKIKFWESKPKLSEESRKEISRIKSEFVKQEVSRKIKN